MNESLGTRPAPHAPAPAPAPTSGPPRWAGRAAAGALALAVLTALAALASIAVADGATTGLTDRLWTATLVLLTASVVLATAVHWRSTRRPPADPVSATSRWGTWGRVPRPVAWALLAGWVLVTVVGVLTADRTRTLSDLDNALLLGQVDEVTVVDDGFGALGPDAAGTALVELRWSVHGLDYVAEVTQVQGSEAQLRAARDRSGLGTNPAADRIRGDVTTYVRGVDPSVRVVPGVPRERGLEIGAFGWVVSGWLVAPALALLAMTLRLLAISPEPWRATRFAWVWISFLLLPLGPIAFLLLGGPTGAVRRNPSGLRLTGGWALLLCWLLVSHD